MSLIKYLKSTSGGIARPFLMFALLMLIGGAMMSGPGAAGGSGLSCRMTDSVEINRVLCKLNPDRILSALSF